MNLNMNLTYVLVLHYFGCLWYQCISHRFKGTRKIIYTMQHAVCVALYCAVHCIVLYSVHVAVYVCTCIVLSSKVQYVY